MHFTYVLNNILFALKCIFLEHLHREQFYYSILVCRTSDVALSNGIMNEKMNLLKTKDVDKFIMIIKGQCAINRTIYLSKYNNKRVI